MPAYKHDCDHCTFLGAVTNPDGKLIDLYVCEGQIDTIIARYSSDGADYASAETSSAMMSISHPELRMAAALVNHKRQHGDTHPDLVWF